MDSTTHQIADKFGAGVSSELSLKRRSPIVSVTLQDESRYSCGLLGIAGGEIQLISELPVPESFSGVVQFDRVAVAGYVLYCRSRGDCYRVCFHIVGHERSEPRFPLTNPCTATILDDEYRKISGRLKDFSQSGLGMVLVDSCPIGAMMYVETDSLLIVGEVRHCREEDDSSKYVVGLATTEIHTDANTARHRPWKARLQEWIGS